MNRNLKDALINKNKEESIDILGESDEFEKEEALLFSIFIGRELNAVIKYLLEECVIDIHKDIKISNSIALLIEEHHLLIDAIAISPFDLARILRNIDMMEMLNEYKKLDIEEYNKYGYTSVIPEIMNNLEDSEKKAINMLDNGSSPIICHKITNDYPIHYSIRYGFNTLTRILIEKYNVCVNVKNIEGNSPLHEAVNSVNKTMIELLLSMNADVNLKNIYNKTPIEYAYQTSQIFHQKMKEHYENILKIIEILESNDEIQDICQTDRNFEGMIKYFNLYERILEITDMLRTKNGLQNDYHNSKAFKKEEKKFLDLCDKIKDLKQKSSENKENIPPTTSIFEYVESNIKRKRDDEIDTVITEYNQTHPDKKQKLNLEETREDFKTIYGENMIAKFNQQKGNHMLNQIGSISFNEKKPLTLNSRETIYNILQNGKREFGKDITNNHINYAGHNQNLRHNLQNKRW